MNIRFITIISNIALVSVALSSGTTIPSSTLAGGNTLISKKSTNNPSSDFISSTTSVIATKQVTSSPSATTILTSTTVANPTTTISNSPSVENQTSPHNSIDSNTTKKPYSTTTTVVSTQTNNSTQQPAGPETTVRPIPSSTTATPVPDTTTEDTKETTAIHCDCSKYLTTSITSNAPALTKPANSSTAAPLVTTTSKPANSSTAAPLVTTTSKPANSSTAAPLVTTTSKLAISSTAAPLVTTTSKPAISSTAAPLVTTTSKPTISSTAAPLVTTTPKPAISSKAAPLVTTNSKPAISSTAAPLVTTTPKPAISSTAAPLVTTTSKPAISSKAAPLVTTTSKPAHSSTSATLVTTTSKPANLSTAAPPKRRRDVSADLDIIQHDDASFVNDDTSTQNKVCMDYCYKTMNETTTGPSLTTTTERPTTTTPRHRSIDLSGKSVVIQLVIVVDDTFTPNMTKGFPEYRKLANQYKTALTAFYSNLLRRKFKKIDILDFSSGSINCNYSLEITAPTNESEANSTVKELRDVKWKKDSLMNLTIDVNKTIAVQKDLLANDKCVLPINVCAHHEVLDWDKNGNPECKYKCDIPENKVYCGAHGECSFTYEGSIRCICKDGYSGKLCIPPKPTTTTAKPIKPDAIALSKIDIIGIAAGIGGGLVLILLVALCCVYTKLNKAKKRDRFYGYMDNDKEFLHDENSRIENVPDLKNEYTNLGYQTEQNELQMQRFEPEGKNVEYEPGQRQGAYERDDKAYRQVEEPEGGNVLIYQPKHLNGPMERQSGASKFDEVEERSNPYRMMDTDTTYKIRRPTVNSDRNVPYN